MLINELDTITSMNHKHVVKCVEVIESRTHVYVVMDMIVGGELHEFLKKKRYFSEFETCYIMYHLLIAISYLHTLGIIHRDLKPENILVELDGKKERICTLKIIDFGLSCLWTPSSNIRDACGTPAYVAPEVIKKQKYSCSADMWNIGIIAYLLYSFYIIS